MKKLICLKATYVLLAILAPSVLSRAQTLTTLYSFSLSDGANPYAPLVQGLDGNLYGTTNGGGTAFNGTVFKITPAGALTSLYSFCSPNTCPAPGLSPQGGLVQAPNGMFYGTTSGGSGTAYAISPSGTWQLLHVFCSVGDCLDGEFILGGLTLGIGGDLFGTTLNAGANASGTVFKIAVDGTLTTLNALGGVDGQFPEAGLVLGSDGMFYGTTFEGGANAFGGTAFKMTRTGNLTPLYNFCSQTNCNDGAGPAATLVEDRHGNFWGTTFADGAHGNGTVFRMTPTGTLTTIHGFRGTDGEKSTAALIQATNGNMYGTTAMGGANGWGVLYEITQAGNFTVLHNFTDGADGAFPQGLMQATDGALYGSATHGGNNSCGEGCGLIFKLDLGLKPFVSFVQNFGKVGQTGQILGQGLTGTTSVQLNGSPVTFTVFSDTLIQATVPSGAATGYVTVTTPSGKLTSNVPFIVIR